MQQIEALFADYSAFHQTPGNKVFHRFGIPMIRLGLIGMLARVHVGPVDAAMLLIALAEIYYLAIEWRLGVMMLVVSVGFYFLGLLIPLWANVALFVLGWIFQFIGHSVYEHRNPAFFRNFTHLLIGPLWILNDLIPVVRLRALP
jgi:uncharacterized membrane protein YGL010W